MARNDSTQLSLPLSDPSPLDLPELEASTTRTRIWTSLHVLMPAKSGKVTQQGIDKAGRSVTTGNLGKLVLVREGVRAPTLKAGITGILREGPDGKLVKWLAHTLLSSFEANERSGRSVHRDFVFGTWRNALSFTEESGLQPGFRRPQIGGLHAIGAHWSLSREPASLVMPTGTGKTETMLAALVAFSCRCVLVVTPSTAVRDQVAEKFRTLGKLREYGLVSEGAFNPVVGIIKRRPRNIADLEVFERCNVVVSTVAAIAQGTAEPLAAEIAKLCTHLFIDEAHHVPASSWSHLKTAFSEQHVLQFTATPFREDGQRIDGKLIYNYPLGLAQREGYFKHIHFNGIFEENEEKEDEAIAFAAVTQLRSDLEKGHDHILMARCSSKTRASKLFSIYQRIAPELCPVEIHSDIQKAKAKTRKLFERSSRIVVCVNMLAEGFDLPNLKVAAIHDKHKSLAVLLQFVGRFTRTAAPSAKIEDATVVANLADPEVAEALRALYVEDADWDQLLSEVHMERMEREKRIMGFLRSARTFAVKRPRVALGTLRPKQSVLLYETDQFFPENFIDALGPTDELEAAWVLDEWNMVVSVHRGHERVMWTRNRRVEDELWELRAAYFHKEKKILFIHGSDPEDLYGELAKALSADKARRLEGSDAFRVFGGINRLTLHQIGIKRQSARRAVSYTQHSGSDVKHGLASAELEHSRKAMISGTGFEAGARVAVGGSRKGKVWARQGGHLLDFRDWCDRVAIKVRDGTIDPDAVVRDGLKAETIEGLPQLLPLRMEWGERLQSGGFSTSLSVGSREYGIYECNLEIRGRRADGGIEFTLVTIDEKEFNWVYEVNKGGYRIRKLFEETIDVKRGRNSMELDEYFQEDPPAILFVDGSEVLGAEIFRAKTFGGEFSESQLAPVDWAGVDITVESIWKRGVQRPNSVQQKALDLCIQDGFDFIFNDDDAGEVADLIAMRKTDSGFLIRLLHCKYSNLADPGARIKDVTEVAAQAARSVRWTGRFQELAKQLKRRSRRLQGKNTRFIHGNQGILGRYERLATAVAPAYEIVVVQPGVSSKAITPDQKTVLAAADAYLRQTVEIPLTVWCSE